MKKDWNFWKVGLLMLALVTVSSACSDENDDWTSQEQVDKHVPRMVVTAFEQEFPQASNVAWTEKDGYFVASFVLPAAGRSDDRRPNQAWFLSDGTLVLSELDVPMGVWESDATFAPVLNAWKASTYCQQGFHIEEVEVVNRQGSKDKVVKVEIEKGKEEFDLFFTFDGTLVKAVADTDGDDDAGMVPGGFPCPPELQKYLQAYYPDAVVVDFERDHDKGALKYGLTVLIQVGQWKVEKELVFDAQYRFLYAEIDLDDCVMASLLQKFLTPEQLAKLVELTGEQNPAEWDFEIIENEKGLLTVSVEDRNDRMVELVKDFDPSQLKFWILSQKVCLKSIKKRANICVSALKSVI